MSAKTTTTAGLGSSNPPVIDSLSPAGPITAAVGTRVTVTASVHDPDAKTETFTFTLTDPEGNVSSPSSVVVNWTDGPLTLNVATNGSSVVAVAGMVATIQG